MLNEQQWTRGRWTHWSVEELHLHVWVWRLVWWSVNFLFSFIFLALLRSIDCKYITTQCSRCTHIYNWKRFFSKKEKMKTKNSFAACFDCICTSPAGGMQSKNGRRKKQNKTKCCGINKSILYILLQLNRCEIAIGRCDNGDGGRQQ